MHQIAIFASGAGSNARAIINYFKSHPGARVSLIICNNPAAGVLSIAQEENIPHLVIEKEKFFRGNAYVDELNAFHIDFIVLAGFLWKLPSALVHAFHHKIINIHPALLPKFGGKGMYGRHVHQLVLDQKEAASGITIHYVDDQYDHGKTIFQATCPVQDNDTAESLAAKIHTLEHEHYPRVIEQVIMDTTGRPAL